MPSQGREGEGPPSAVGLGTAVSLALGPLIGVWGCASLTPGPGSGCSLPGEGVSLSLGWVLKAGRPRPYHVCCLCAHLAYSSPTALLKAALSISTPPTLLPSSRP